MGGLFSSNEKPREPNRNYVYETSLRSSASYNHSPSTTYNHSPPTTYNDLLLYRRQLQQARPPTRQPSYSDHNQAGAITSRFDSLRISRQPSIRIETTNRQPSRTIEDRKLSVYNPRLLDLDTTEIVTYTELEPYDSEYLQITRMITNKRNFKVDKIEKIENPYLEAAFELKKHQKQAQFDYVEERLLFHGTKWRHVDDICTKNFDWRKCQTHKYGRGVSFSPNSTYASVYSDERVRSKVMIVVKVLIGNSCIGNKNMLVPPDGYDTSQKGNDGIVIVKFDDNEFCPVYKIKFHVMDENVGRGRGNKSRRGGVNRQHFAAAPVFSYDDDLDFSFYD